MIIMDIQVKRQEQSLQSGIQLNKVVRNTYMLLSMPLLFSAFTAFLAVAANAAPVNIFVFLIGAYGLMFLTVKLKNSTYGLLSVFAFTGFMGYTLGPIINFYLQMPSGAETVAMALGSTGVIFVALSGYALVSRKDFSFLGGFIFAGAIVLIGAMLLSIFFNTPGMQLAISAGFVLFASASILWETSQMIHKEQETNYILVTIGLYTSIYNLFLSLLQLISAFRGND